MAGEGFYCQFCDCTLNTKNEFDQHCKGKKHTANERLAHEHEVANRRIFVRGFDGVRNPQGFLGQYFINFGKLEYISFGGNHGNSYAFVEFSNPETVSRVMNVKQHRIGGQVLHVKPFKLRPSSWESKRFVHQELEQHEIAKQAQTKNHTVEMLMSAENLNDQINVLAKSLKLDLHDQRARVQICQELSSLFAPHFENCKIHQFGSSVNGFGAKGCDLDLFLDLNIQDSSSDVGKSKVKKLAQIVSSSSKFTKTLTIPSLRCPVVRFVHKATDIKCDLSINNRKALHNSYLLRLYSSDPRVYKLVSIVRLWAKIQGLSGSSGGAHLFTSYAITLIVIFFLLHRDPKIIPLVCDVEKCIEGTRREVVDDWECLNVPSNATLPPSENKDTDVDLVKEFFAFCSDSVDWDTDALVMKDASIIRRSSISLDPSYIGCKAGCMTVLDPFVLTHNVVANVNEKTKVKFVAELQRAAELTREWPACVKKSASDPWGLAALLVPSPDQETNIPGKKSGRKATKPLATNEGDIGTSARVTKNSITRVEGEQENGDFCITVQPLPSTLSCAKLLLTAKQNNVRPAEQWCIMAQELILDVLKTVFMVEVEEAEMVEIADKGKKCEDVNLIKQLDDESPGEGDMKDVGNFSEAVNLERTEKDDGSVAADGARNTVLERKDILPETSSGKRTSDAAHLDGNGIESMDDSRTDFSSLQTDSFQNPKKKFCEGVGNTVNYSSDVMANNLVIDKSVNHDENLAVNKCGDNQHNSVGCIQTTDNNRNGLDDQDHNTCSSGSKVQTTVGSEGIEALPDLGASTSSTCETHRSLIQAGSSVFSGILSDSPTSSGSVFEIKTSKTVSYNCRCKHQLWIGRKKMHSQLFNKDTLSGLALEQEITKLILRKQSNSPKSIEEAHHSSRQEQYKNQKIEGGQKGIGKHPETSPPIGQADKEKKKNTPFSKNGQGEESTAEATDVQKKTVKAELPEIQFTCQIFHQNCDSAFKLPHILIKLRPSESSSNQFKNLYCSFRSQVLHLLMEHFLDIYT